MASWIGRVPPWVADAVIAVLAAGLLAPQSVSMVLHGNRSVGLTSTLLFCVGVQHMALVVRRRWTWFAFCAISIATLATAVAPSLEGQTARILGGPVPPIMVPSTLVFSVALHAVASWENNSHSRLALDVSLAGAVLVGVRLWSVQGWNTGVPDGLGWRLFLVLALAGAGFAPWAWGRMNAAQRAYAQLLTDTAVQTERRRIAAEMHDILAHSLAVVVRLAEGARLVVDRDPEQTRTALGNIEKTSRTALQEVRSVLGVVSDGPTGRAPSPTLSDLESLVDATRAGGVAVELETIGPSSKLSGAGALAAYRVVQESLTNVAKHAGPAAQAQVHLEHSPSCVRIRIRDDGHPVGDYVPGRGLLGMAERVQAVGGSLTHHCGDNGFVVEATIPAGVGHER